MKKNNYFDKVGGPQNNTFEQSKSREITTNPKTVYIDNVKITTNNEKVDKKLFYLPKKNKLIYSDSDGPTPNKNKNNTREGFSLNYLGKIQRKRIEEHLAQGKTLKCHHKNCFWFNEEFTTLYDYNIHCHTSNHVGQPIHPELPLIQILNLEPRGNPWEEVVKNDTYLALGSSKNDNELQEKYYDDVVARDEGKNQGGLQEYI